MIKGNITELGEKLNAVVWAYNSEPWVVEGITATKFKPFNTCSRAQVICMLNLHVKIIIIQMFF